MNSIIFENSSRRCQLKKINTESVDKDIQSMLRPLNILQTLCFCPKYRIKINIIHPNSLLSNVLSVCGAMFFISVFLYRVIVLYLNDFVRENLNFLCTFSYCVFWCCFVGYSLNCFLNIGLAHKNIEFVLTIQRIHRFLNNKKLLKYFTLVNWITVLCFFTTHILFVYCNYWEMSTLFLLFLFCFDANLIYAMQCITLLKGMLDSWNEEVLHPQLMWDMDMKDYCKTMFLTYTDILTGYDTLKLTFKHFVSNRNFGTYNH